MLPTNEFAVTVPVTFKLVSVPTVVMLGCDAVVRLPAIVVALIAVELMVVRLPVGADIVVLAAIAFATMAPEPFLTTIVLGVSANTAV